MSMCMSIAQARANWPEIAMSEAYHRYLQLHNGHSPSNKEVHHPVHEIATTALPWLAGKIPPPLGTHCCPWLRIAMIGINLYFLEMGEFTRTLLTCSSRGLCLTKKARTKSATRSLDGGIIFVNSRAKLNDSCDLSVCISIAQARTNCGSRSWSPAFFL